MKGKDKEVVHPSVLDWREKVVSSHRICFKAPIGGCGKVVRV